MTVQHILVCFEMLVWIHVCIKQVHCSPLLPFGSNHPSDATASLTDDSDVDITTAVPFPFYGAAYSEVRVVSNGFIAFGGSYTDCCGSKFPQSNIKTAPLWDDLVPGTIWYRQTTTDQTDLVAAETHVRNIYPAFSTFDATWALVATWDKFEFYDDRDQVTTFQVILTTDGTNCFAIFLYEFLDHVSPGTVGVDTGDGVNYYELCISRSNALLDLEQVRQSCDSEAGVLAFRVDSVNPDQATYTCTEVAFPPKASYYCKWKDQSQTTLVVSFKQQYPACGIMTKGIMAWDTEKYENGENPNLSDPSCETVGSSGPTIDLDFEIDPDAMTPACGVVVTGTTVKTLDITVRSWNGGVQFDVENDAIYRFTCTTETALPASVEDMKEFNDIDINTMPILSRSTDLQVKAPNIDDVLSEVRHGQLIQLRIIYDNTANNIEPKRVYVKSCTVADTMDFDTTTATLIQDGCVVESDPDAVWYMSRSFQETSLSAAGLFITDSGLMAAAKFLNVDKLFFRCVINFCFFDQLSPDLCADSCATRKKRSVNETEVKSQAIYTSVKISDVKDTNGNGTEQKICKRKWAVYMYIVLGALGAAVIFVLLVAVVIFCKILRLPTSKQSS